MTTTKDRRREFRLATSDDDLLIDASALSTHFGFRSIEGDAQGRMFICLDEALDAVNQPVE